MSVKQRILDALAYGPATPREMARQLDEGDAYVRVQFCRLHKEGRIYISEYRREEEDGRLYPRAVYSIGNGKAAKPPKPLTRTEYNRRYRARCRGSVNSVFALAGNINTKRVAMDWRPRHEN